MHRPSYANVAATLALVVALGGTSYAVSQVTGKDVKNGSLTGKDLKKRSVPQNRLKGSLDFVPETGLYTVSVGPNGWQSLSTDLVRENVFGDWTSTTASGGTPLLLDPELPTTTAGKPMRLRAVTLCWDATGPMLIAPVTITTFRENSAAVVTDIVEIDDPDDHEEKTCKRYPFSPPVTLAANSRVSVKVTVNWSGSSDSVHIGGATFELDRVP